MRVAPLLLLLLSCRPVECDAPTMAAEQLYPADVRAAFSAWQRHGRGLGDCHRGELRVGFVEQLAGDGLYGMCGDRRYVLPRSADRRAQRAATLHELMHYLSECEGGDADGGHENAAVWGRDGVLGPLLLELRD